MGKEKPAASKSIVGIVAKASQPLAVELTRKVRDWLVERKIEYRLDDEVAKSPAFQGLPASNIAPRAELPAMCDIIVVLGGDGTLISVSHHASCRPPRIVGVNVGTLGFLTEITVDEVFQSLDAALSGTAKFEPHYLLKAVVREASASGDRPEIKSFHAINDIVISKEALARIFAVEVSVDGAIAATIRGDGVIVSTPAGSTAYSLAAGGSIVHPAVSALLVTPICPHSLTTRPLVLPGGCELRLKVLSSAKIREGEVYLTVDGQQGMALEPNHEIEVTTSQFHVLMAKSATRSYFDVLGTKLKWAKS